MNGSRQSDVEAVARVTYRRLSGINGLLLGVALAAGLWGPEMVQALRLPVRLQLPSLVFGALLVVALCVGAGWLTGRTERVVIIVAFWLGTTALIAYLVSLQPTWGRTLTVWLADRRFWGTAIYPNIVGLSIAPIFVGFFIALVLGLLAIVQPYRLEGIAREMGANGRLSADAWRLLLLPLPLVLGAGYLTSVFVGDPAAEAVAMVHEAIVRTRDYEGDLQALGLAEGLNYNALRGVRDRLDGRYSLLLGSANSTDATTIVVAHFESGEWLNCRILGDSLSFCFDAAPPYRDGLAALLTGTPLPESCRNCLPDVSDEWRDWLRERGARLGKSPIVQREAQWGGDVLMRAEGNGTAVECWFRGLNPVTLDRCDDATP